MLIPVVDVLALIPVARSTLYLRMAEPDFPKPIKIGGKVFWESKEIEAYIESKKKSAVLTAGLPSCSTCGGTKFEAHPATSQYLVCIACMGR